MMNQSVPGKRLYRIAMITSTAIGLITTGPVYVMFLTIGNFHLSNTILFKVLGASIIGITLFVMAFWMINISLLDFSIKRSYLFKRANSRYLTSYLVCFGIILLIWSIASFFINSPEMLESAINWKSKLIGINPKDIDILPFSNRFFLLMIALFVVISINSVVLILQELVLLIEKKTRTENENIALRIKNIEASNQKLKQQLQPHFLFNSLNVLKSLIKKQPDDAETYLKRLSDFLRSSVLYDKENTISLEEELKLGLDYIEMQKIRFGDAIKFEMNIPEEIKNGSLPIFSVQMLLENAIKHNAFTPEAPLLIRLEYHDGWLTVTNPVQKKTSEEATSGMGLFNLSERYRLISGDEVVIKADESIFSVSIKILDHEDCNS
jgi:two-component system, LytTR family, sensor kinase